MSSKYEEAMLEVLDYLLAHDGCVEDEPGQLLKRIAQDTGVPYKAVSLAVLGLEKEEMIQVGRSARMEAWRANRVESIHII